jgi:SAM-dependent methyltransferase
MKWRPKLESKVKHFVRNKKNTSPTEFLTIGLASHALCLIERAGILNFLLEQKIFNQSQLKEYKNPHLLRAALVTLVHAKVLKLKNNIYNLTTLGKKLANSIGIFMLPLVGYRNLFLKQYQLLDEPDAWNDSEIDYKSIALASINFGLNDLDPILIDLITSMNPKGTICDLGCGTGEKLIKICEKTNTNGLGFEKDPKVIEAGKKFRRKKTKIEIIQADIRKLRGVWEDVEIGLISFVLHDIDDKNDCINFLNSLPVHFQRLQCLFIVDIVSLSEGLPYAMPGFDYVHGLQGITPRTYEETQNVFSESNYKFLREISIPNMENTFIWALLPTKTR